MKKIKTPIISPGNYCLCYQQGNTKTYFAPFYHTLGNTLRTSPEVLERRMKYAQKYNRRYHNIESGKEEGTLPYSPKLFPWPEELLEDQDIFGTFREAVNKEEKAYTLVDCYPGEAIIKLKLMGDLLVGKVKSKEEKRSEKEADTHTYYLVEIKGLFLDDFGEPELVYMSCQCPKHEWDETKGTDMRSDVECSHVSAIGDEYNQEINYPDPFRRLLSISDQKDLKKNKNGTMSLFSFSGNWFWDKINRRYVSKDKNLQVFEEDALIAHYLLGEKHLEINKKALSQPDVYSKLSLNLLGKGRLTFEILAHRAGTLSEDERLKDLNNVFPKARQILTKYGYFPDGKYLELGMPAWRYRHGDNVVGVVFSENKPPFYVVKQGFDSPIRPWDEDRGETNPFKLIGRRNQRRLDDKTKKWTSHRTEALSDLRLPETDFKAEKLPVSRELKSWMKEAIQQNNPDSSEWKLRYCNL